jgi:aldose 1-epimerase
MGLRFRQPRETGPLVRIGHGPYELVAAPHFGGRIVSLTWHGRDVLRPTPEAIIANPKVYEFAGFPLMPYSGPLFGPGFAFAGIDYVLDRTVREEPSATHGDAWISPFQIVDRNDASVSLRYDHEPEQGMFPFRFRGDLRFALSQEGLSIAMQVTSRDHRPMPAGFGFHPYFPKPKGTRLRFEAVGVWPADAPEAVTLPCGPLIEGLSFRDGADVSEMVVDRLYEGWDGRAELSYEDGQRTTITADGALDKMQIYSAWHYPYVCVEPVSNANDGFNRMAAGVPSHGVRVLEPNRSIEGTIRIAAGEGASS